MNSKFVTMILLSLISTASFGHGMNKYGPNGGYIKMPGAYHTELIDKGAKMHVYLLDMSFKNPTTENSSVIIKYKGKTESTSSCIKAIDHFVCDKPKEKLTEYNEITISSIRNSNKAKDAQYSLPLKLE